MRWLLYNVLFAIGFGLALPRYLLRMRKRGGYRPGFAQRFGRYAPETQRKLNERTRYWTHAVSVGEVQVALRFMAEMRRADPAAAFVLTVNTPTAWRIAERALPVADVLLWFPLDFPFVTRRVLRQFGALRALILTEKELWPNLIRACASRNVPVFLINARMSERSAAGYRKLRGFFAPVLRRLDLVLAQSEADRRRLIGIGADPDRVAVAGSAKYDAANEPPPDFGPARALLARAGHAADTILFLGGSTWPGEETALCDIYRAVRDRHPRLRLVLVPRHAERRAEVARALAETGLRPVLRSRLDTDVPLAASESATHDDVLIVDSTGELDALYACADIVFVGKSLGRQRGGQNVIEPARFGKPIVTGPHMENFEEIMAEFRAADAIAVAADADRLRDRIENWLADESARLAQGQRARAVVEARRGAMRQSVARIMERLRSPGPATPT